MVLVFHPPLYGTHSHLAFATLPISIPFVGFLKLTASSRPSVPPSDLPKCLRFGHWLTLSTLIIHLLTYILLTINIQSPDLDLETPCNSSGDCAFVQCVILHYYIVAYFNAIVFSYTFNN